MKLTINRIQKKLVVTKRGGYRIIDIGRPGPSGIKGEDGDSGIGWTPVIATIVDGERRVQRVVDWLGGEDDKPATGQYIGGAGFVVDIAEATDIRGAAGDDAGAAVSSVNTRTGEITLTKADVGLANVDNTADAAKPVSTAQATAIGLKANITSPTFGGIVTAPSLNLTSATIPANGAYLAAANVIAFATNSLQNMSLNAVGILTVGNTARASGIVINSNLNECLVINGASATGAAINLNATLGRLYQFYSNAGSKKFGVYDATIGATPLFIYGGSASGVGGQLGVNLGCTIGFSNNAFADSGALDTGISRLAAGHFGFGNGINGNKSATISCGDIIVSILGKGIYVKEGLNATMGRATLVAGTITVPTTKVTAESRIMLTVETPSGTQGFLSTAKTAGTSFTINSTSATDASVVNWIIIEPAP